MDGWDWLWNDAVTSKGTTVFDVSADIKLTTLNLFGFCVFVYLHDNLEVEVDDA